MKTLHKVVLILLIAVSVRAIARDGITHGGQPSGPEPAHPTGRDYVAPTPDLIRRLAEHVGQTVYVASQNLLSGQTEYGPKSLDQKVKEKAQEVKHRPIGFVSSLDGQVGETFFSHEKPAEAILFDGKIIVIDGNHKVLTNRRLGGEMIPVTIVADWQELSREAGVHALIDRGLIFPWLHTGERVEGFRSFSELTPNEYRDFAANLLVTVRSEEDKLDLKLKPKRRFVIGAKTRGRAIAYVEFYLSLALHQAGVRLEDLIKEQSGSELSLILHKLSQLSPALHPALIRFKSVELFHKPVWVRKKRRVRKAYRQAQRLRPSCRFLFAP